METTAPTPASEPAPAPVISGANQPTVAAPKRGRPGWLKWLVIGVAGLLVLLGASAGAYYGYYLPNQPESRLVDSITNLRKLEQVNGTMTLDYKAGSNALSMNMLVVADSKTGSYQLAGTLGFNGAQFPVDMRIVNQDMYIKVGGLNGLTAGMVGASVLPDFSKLNDQWFVLDHSILKKGAANCSTDLTITDEDVASFKKAYGDHPLLKVKGTSQVTVDGEPATKMTLVDNTDAEEAKFIDALKNLTLYRKLESCVKTLTDSSGVKPDDTTAALTGDLVVYITKDNMIKKVELQGTNKDAQMQLSFTLKSGTATVEKPAGAKPLQDALGALLYGSSAL